MVFLILRKAIFRQNAIPYFKEKLNLKVCSLLNKFVTCNLPLKLAFSSGKSAILTQAKTPFKACFTGQKEET